MPEPGGPDSRGERPTDNPSSLGGNARSICLRGFSSGLQFERCDGGARGRSDGRTDGHSFPGRGELIHRLSDKSSFRFGRSHRAASIAPRCAGLNSRTHCGAHHRWTTAEHNSSPARFFIHSYVKKFLALRQSKTSTLYSAATANCHRVNGIYARPAAHY